jgi:hypothetical protein
MALFNFLTSSSNNPLFDADDVRELVQAFPPRSGTEKGKFVNHFDPEHSFLIPTASGLIKPKHVLEKLRRKLSEESGRLSISSLAENLQVEQNVVRSLLRHIDGDLGPVWSADEAYTLTFSERRKLQDLLLQELQTSLVNPEVFARENDMQRESIDYLANTDLLNDGKSQSVSRFATRLGTSQNTTFLFSDYFYQDLRQKLDTQLEAARSGGVSCSIHSASTARGAFIRKVLDECGLLRDGQLEEQNGSLVFVPDSSLRQQFETEAEKLRSGQTCHASIASFAAYLPQDSDATRSVRNLLEERLKDDAKFWDLTVASTRWWDDLIQDICNTIEDRGWVKPVRMVLAVLGAKPCSTLLTLLKEVHPTLPSSSTDALQMRQQLLAEISNRLESRQVVYRSITSKGNTYFLTRNLEDKCLSRGKDIAPVVARRHFESGNEKTSDDEVWKDEYFLSFPEEIRRDLSKTFKDEIRNSYDAELGSLRTMAQRELVELWTARISTRSHLHVEAADTVESTDAKLTTQLREALFDYLVLDAIPDFIKIAEKQHCFQASRKVMKESGKFRDSITNLAAQIKAAGNEKDQDPDRDLKALREAIDTFAQKSSIASPTSEDLASRKQSLCAEIANRMQKDSDGPRLFLSLLIVLLAQSLPGVTYATGKMAPRLLKVLKAIGGVTEADALKLEGWKEEVRKGKVSSETRQAMKTWAKDVVSQHGGENLTQAADAS